MGNGFGRSKFKKYLRNGLAGAALMGAFIISGPYFNAKIKNIDLNFNPGREYILKRERGQLEELVNKYDKSKTNEMLYTFDQITDFKNTTHQIIKKFRLNDYEDGIRRKVSSIPDIEAYSEFWLILNNLKVPRTIFRARAFEGFQTIFLNQKDDPFYPTILRHEYMHSIGTLGTFLDASLIALNEGLTQYFSNIVFDDLGYEGVWNYYNEQKLVKVLEEISSYIEKKDGVKYSILAKCFFIDNNINEFIQRFDNNFGKDKFNSIFYGKGDFYDKGVKFDLLIRNG